MRITPDCVPPWDAGFDDVGGNLDITVRGNGFEPGSSVALRFAEETSGLDSDVGAGSILRVDVSVVRDLALATGESPALATVTADDLGAFETTIATYWPYDEGRYLVTALTRGGGPAGSAVLLVPCPTGIDVTPDCSGGGGSSPPSATISGHGFLPGSPVFLQLLGGNVEDSLGSVDAASDGTFTFGASGIGGLPEGTYQVLADQPRSERRAIGFLESPCPSPRVRLRPDCGPPGTSPARLEVGVVGAGFQPGAPAYVIWDPRASHEVWPVQTDEEGGFSATIRPLARPDGSYTVRVESWPARAPVRVATASFTVPCEVVLPEVSISLEPDCGRPALSDVDSGQYALTVRGQGFQPGGLAVVFDAQPVMEQERFEAEADGTGAFEVTISPNARPSGTYLVLAVQPYAPPATRAPETTLLLEATATFRVPCRGRTPPPPVLDPDCGPDAPSQADAYRIAVSGSDFYGNGLVLVSFGRGSNAPTVMAPTEPDGSYATLISVGGRGPGSYPVRVLQRDAGGTELARAEALFSVPCATDPRMSIRPAAGPPGYTALVEGSDFPPGTIVTLRWDRGIDAGRAFEVGVGAEGRFSVHLFILPNDFPGRRTLRAGRPGEPDAYPGVTARYLVVAGSAAPPGRGRAGYVFRR